MGYVLSIIGGIVIGLLIVLPFIKSSRASNESIFQENQRLITENKTLAENIDLNNIIYNQTIDEINQKKELKAKVDTDYIKISDTLNLLKENKEKVLVEYEKLQSKKDELNKAIQDLENNAEQQRQAIYNLSSDKLNADLDKLVAYFEQEKQHYQEEYEQCLADCAAAFANKIAYNKQCIDELQEALENEKEKYGALNEARIREKEKAEQINNYRIVLSDQEKKELAALQELEPIITNKRSLYMFIWSNYYQKKAKELAEKIFSKGNIGIYKITNTITNEIYIGQSTNCKDRIQQHLKCGLKIDTPTNKLYQNMIQYGVDNFTFELQQSCSQQELNEKERYWISFYQSNEFGLNSTKGNKN